MHPLPILMNQGVPITLNSDDPAAFGNMGLSFDFFQVLIVSEVTGLLTVKALARDSLKVCCRQPRSRCSAELNSRFAQYACLAPEEQSAALTLFDKRWSTFVQWLVDTFSGEARS